LAAAGLALLSMFSCSYGDREDRKEDEKAKRTVLALPSSDFAIAFSHLQSRRLGA
jgi:hypothetical protein